MSALVLGCERRGVFVLRQVVKRLICRCGHCSYSLPQRPQQEVVKYEARIRCL